MPSNETVVYFVNPVFHLVSVIAVHMMLCGRSKFSLLVDVFAAFYLIIGTRSRAHILDVLQESLTAETVYNYLDYSLASWIAAVILEIKTCIFTYVKTRVVIGRILRTNRVQYRLKDTVILLVLVLNSSVVMLYFCFDVSRSVLDLTSDPWLIWYHRAASLMKTLSAVLQGIFLITHILSDQPVYDKRFTLRMAFINFVTVIHSFYLLRFGIFGRGLSSIWSLDLDKMVRFLSLILDISFRIGLCYWYLTYSYCCLLMERLMATIMDYVQVGMGENGVLLRHTDQDSVEEESSCSSDTEYDSTVKFAKPCEETNYVAELADFVSGRYKLLTR